MKVFNKYYITTVQNIIPIFIGSHFSRKIPAQICIIASVWAYRSIRQHSCLQPIVSSSWLEYNQFYDLVSITIRLGTTLKSLAILWWQAVCPSPKCIQNILVMSVYFKKHFHLPSFSDPFPTLQYNQQAPKCLMAIASPIKIVLKIVTFHLKCPIDKFLQRHGFIHHYSARNAKNVL